MALINDPDNLKQGATTTPADAAWTSAAGANITITGAATLPLQSTGDFFEVRDHSVAVNNGLYVATGVPTTSSLPATKVSGSNPSNSAAEAVTMLGSTTTRKNIFWDTAARQIYLLEKNGLSADGTLGQAVYSKAMIDWKDDAFLIANAPFPMLCIDADAGKYFVGQDASGNYSGWTWKDNGTFSIRTRKLLRNMGWSEIDVNGITKATYFGCVTLGAFEDPAADVAYYQFGTNTTLDDTVDFTFAGPVNEAVKVFEELGNPPTCNFATSSTITRASGSFITDGYKKGGRVTVRAATVGANNGTYTLTAVAATTLTVSGTPFTTGADAAAQLSVDNLNKVTLKVRVRDADPNGKTFDQSNLARAGETVLANRVFKFPLANATDLKVSATDATVDGSAPYTGMTITYYSAPQSKGGAGADKLVGGPYNFGIVLDANSGTKEQAYEWLHRQLRRTTDIDADADNAIGRTLDDLMQFVGDALKVGSADGGLSFPTNPDGGGSGVFVSNLAAASKNFVTLWDNTGAVRSFPVSVTVTLDFNQTLIDDPVAAYTLFFDRTIRTTVADLKINAGSGATGTITSAGSNLPGALDAGVGAYVRVSGMTGVDAAMNGIYQVTSISTASYNVTRYDGTTIVTTTAGSFPLDQHVVDSPDAVIVQDSASADVTGLATSDYSFNYDYSNNVQGGHTGGTDAYVIAKAIGQTKAQYTQSSVSQIQSGVALTIPLVSAQERNFQNN